VQDVVATRPSLQRTGPFEEEPSAATHRHESLGAVVGTATLAVTAVALAAYAVKERSWRSLAVAAAGAPLLYRGATGRWPRPQALVERRAEPARVETAVTIDRPAGELYAEWRQLENLPRFMKNLEWVIQLDGQGGRRSHWVARTPLGGSVEWDAEIVDERPGRLLSWRSVPGSEIEQAGSVLFEDAPAGRGTIVRVSIEIGRTGRLGRGLLLGGLAEKVPELEVEQDLRRFKALMEAGEIPTTEGQPHGERGAIDVKNPF
jgi:uncharacterized membrane protein